MSVESTTTAQVTPGDPDRDADAGFLNLVGLAKSFGEHQAIKDLNISIPKGELVTFLGPSGCGKTTTLRMIAGFVQNDAGAIYLDGKRIDQLPSRTRGTAMVFQDYALFPHMTVFDNVAFGLRMKKTPKKEIARRVSEALDVVRLESAGKKFPRELSGGMRQRVALARAIVVEPRALLLDEPLSALDAKLRKTVRTELREIHERLGITTVLVTHDLEEAFSIGDRVVVMNHGNVEQYDTPTEIYSRPATPFVADFVGHTNLIEGRWEPAAGDRGVFRGGGLEIATATAPATASAAFYTVPPNNVRVSAAETRPSGDIILKGTVKDLSFLGASFGLVVSVGGIDINTNVVTGSADAIGLGRGSQVWVAWNASEGHCVIA